METKNDKFEALEELMELEEKTAPSGLWATID